MPLDRTKASIYAWDDPRLQKTAVVQKRIAKSATKVQRFIRACISHWAYYNKERAPLLEEMKDVARRRAEELEEVKAFQKRGFEEARFEMEAEMAMPAEEFAKTQKLSKQLKQEIKDEEAATLELEKDIMDEAQRAKRLSREEHEVKAQNTFSRLDVEVPELEAEKLELESADEQFGEVVRALEGQLGAMNLQIGLEEKHKKRLMKTLAKIVKRLESKGANPKMIKEVKLSIMYKGEDPPPKPAPAPAPEPEPKAATPEPEQEPEPEKTAPESTPGPVEPEVQEKSEKSMASSDDDSDSSSSDESTSTSSNSSQEGQQPGPRDSTDKTRASMALRNSTGSSLGRPSDKSSEESLRASTGSTSQPALPHIKRSSTGVEMGTAAKSTSRDAPTSRSVKKTKSSDGDKFNWGDKDMVRRASMATQELHRTRSRSMSPTRRKEKKKSKDKDKSESGGSTRSKSRSSPRRAKSADIDDFEKIKKPEASFNWSTMSGDEGPTKEKKQKKEKKSKKSKDKDKDKEKDKFKRKKKEKESKDKKKSSKRDSMRPEDGHFSWAFHGNQAS